MNSLPLIHIAPGSPPIFPPVWRALRNPNGLLAVGGDLNPERLLAAYEEGIFPWYGPGEPILWFSPDPRCVFTTDRIHLSRSTRQQLRRCGWRISADTAFTAVIEACAAPRGDGHGTWILPEVIDAFVRLHQLGHAHSVEVWDQEQLVGGIYGVAIGRSFAGESMFSRASGGSKAALTALARALDLWGFPLLDAQVTNPHLTSLGAFEMPRAEFLARLRAHTSWPGRVGSWHADFPFQRALELVGA